MSIISGRRVVWLWQWAATVSREWDCYHIRWKALKRTGCKRPDWLDLISGCPINWQRTCTASLWSSELEMSNGREAEKNEANLSSASPLLFILTVRGGYETRGPGVAHVRKFLRWGGEVQWVSWAGSTLPLIASSPKAAKPVGSDNGRHSALELCWFIACGISITALAAGGEEEEEKVAREGWWWGRRKLSSAVLHNMWFTSGMRLRLTEGAGRGTDIY